MSGTHSGQRNLVIEMALMFLPKDGTDWLPRLEEAHQQLSKSLLASDAANVPAKVAQYAFESMGYQYMEIENGEWRRRLGSVAFRHWMLYRGKPDDGDCYELRKAGIEISGKENKSGGAGHGR